MCLTQSLLISKLISSIKNTFIETSRIMFGQISGQNGPAIWTHKINHRDSHTVFYGTPVLELNTGLNWFLSQVFPFIIKRKEKWVLIWWTLPGFQVLAQSSFSHLIPITILYNRYHYQNPWYDKCLTENNILELLLFFNLTLYEKKDSKPSEPLPSLYKPLWTHLNQYGFACHLCLPLICLRYRTFNPLSQATE